MLKPQYTTTITGCQVFFSWGFILVGFGFLGWGVYETRSPIYIYVRVQVRPWGGSFKPDQFYLGRMEWSHLEKCFGAIEPLPRKKSDRMKLEIPAEHSGISGTYTHTQCGCGCRTTHTHGVRYVQICNRSST
jgi:hypothetical protein